MTVDVQIQPRPLDDEEIVLADVEDIFDADRCSCAAGDDNPY